MLSLDPNDLASEVHKAEEFRRKHTLRIKSIVARFVGNWYRTDQSSPATPENTVFAYVSYMLPNLWFSNPSCRIQARRPQTDGPIADAMEAAVRGWFTETTFTQEGQEVVRDALMGYGVMQVGVEPRDFPGDRMQQHGPGQQQQQGGQGNLSDALRPFGVRLSPEQLIMDPQCEDPSKARFIGHAYFKDLDQVQAEAASGMWNAEAVDALSSVSRDSYDAKQERALGVPDTPDRKRVALVDLWIPEQNMLVTLARFNSASNFILRQTTYWGPPEGPYEVYGFYVVPGDPYPLAPLQPIMEQLEEMWTHQRQASTDAETFKRFVVVEDRNDGLKKAISNAKSGEVYSVNGLGDYKVIEMGGTPDGRLAHISQLRDRTDRTVGLSDAQRGRVQGKTATETDIVQGNVDTRTSLMRQRVQWHTQRVLSRVCWYFFFDDSIAMPVTSTDPFTGQVSEGTFLGGIHPGQEGTGWVDFHLTIEPTSMVYTDDATLANRAMTMLQLAQEVGGLMTQMPFVNWREIVNTYGDAINRKNLFDLLFNAQVAQQFGQMQQAGQAMLPGGVNPAIAGGGMGAPGGPAPSWGPAPMAAINGGGGGGGAMPGMPLMGAGGGVPQAFAPRSGGVMGPPGVPMGGMSRPMPKMPGRPGFQRAGAPPSGGARHAAKPFTGNPRSQRAASASAPAPTHTGNPRAAKKAAAGAAK